jgi:hypothetical protein
MNGKVVFFTGATALLNDPTQILRSKYGTVTMGKNLGFSWGSSSVSLDDSNRSITEQVRGSVLLSIKILRRILRCTDFETKQNMRLNEMWREPIVPVLQKT